MHRESHVTARRSSTRRWVRGDGAERGTNATDYQNRAGNKGAGIASDADAQMDRRERLRRLAMETIDLSKVRRAAEADARIPTSCGNIWAASSAVCA